MSKSLNETVKDCSSRRAVGRTLLHRGLVALAALAAAACSDGGGGLPSPDPGGLDPIADAPDEANGHVEITNDQAELDARVLYSAIDVPVDGDESVTLPPGTVPPKPGGSVAMAKASSVTLTLVAEISPPTVAGEVVQATSVSRILGNVAVVGYNMRGAPYLGGVDWIARVDTSRPLLSSGAIFNDADVNAVAADGLRVYMAIATSAPQYPYPAAIERLSVFGNRMRLADNDRAGLISYAATSVEEVGDIVYATSGNTGGVYALAADDFSLLGSFPLNDARWVAWDETGGRIVVVQGTPGQISVFAEGDFPGGSLNLLNTFPFPGADVPESKSTVEISGGKAFIAAGPEGVQIVCLDTGALIGNVPRPDPASLGLDPSVVVTNAVTVDRDLMFISNGEAGVYVARAPQRFSDSGCAIQSIVVEGKLRFANLESANHVSFRSDYLFVAAGLGGVKVVRVRDN
jgi:hypothetical protein